MSYFWNEIIQNDRELREAADEMGLKPEWFDGFLEDGALVGMDPGKKDTLIGMTREVFNQALAEFSSYSRNNHKARGNVRMNLVNHNDPQTQAHYIKSIWQGPPPTKRFRGDDMGSKVSGRNNDGNDGNDDNGDDEWDWAPEEKKIRRLYCVRRNWEAPWVRAGIDHREFEHRGSTYWARIARGRAAPCPSTCDSIAAWVMGRFVGMAAFDEDAFNRLVLNDIEGPMGDGDRLFLYSWNVVLEKADGRQYRCFEMGAPQCYILAVLTTNDEGLPEIHSFPFFRLGQSGYDPFEHPGIEAAFNVLGIDLPARSRDQAGNPVWTDIHQQLLSTIRDSLIRSVARILEQEQMKYNDGFGGVEKVYFTVQREYANRNTAPLLELLRGVQSRWIHVSDEPLNRLVVQPYEPEDDGNHNPRHHDWRPITAGGVTDQANNLIAPHGVQLLEDHEESEASDQARPPSEEAEPSQVPSVSSFSLGTPRWFPNDDEFIGGKLDWFDKHRDVAEKYVLIPPDSGHCILDAIAMYRFEGDSQGDPVIASAFAEAAIKRTGIAPSCQLWELETYMPIVEDYLEKGLFGGSLYYAFNVVVFNDQLQTEYVAYHSAHNRWVNPAAEYVTLVIGGSHCAACKHSVKKNDKWFTWNVSQMYFEIYGHGGVLCPYCGEFYTTQNVAYHIHGHELERDCRLWRCSSCNMCMKREFSEFHKLHCTSKEVVLSKELEKFNEEALVAETGLRIYADLECSINAAGVHEPILIGYTTNMVRDVTIHTSILEAIHDWTSGLTPYLPPEERKNKKEKKKKPDPEEIEADRKARARATALVFFHNGKNYDFHFIIRTICHHYKTAAFSNITADSSEKFQSFTVRLPICKKQYVFLSFRDSYQFLPGSLESIVDDMKKDPSIHWSYFEHAFRAPEERELVLRKNIFPYTWIDSADKLKRPIVELVNLLVHCADNKQYFREDLSLEELVEKSRVGLEVIERMKFRTVGDYYKMYLTCDVAQMADAMENFSELAMKVFGIHPFHCLGMPGLSWHSMMINLRKRGVELQAIPNQHYYDVIKASIRGGMCGVMQRLWEQSPDDEGEVDHAYYLDCNSLYPTAMCKFKYPVGGFKELGEDPLGYWNQCAHKNMIPPGLEVLGAPESNQGAFIRCTILPDIGHETYDYPLFPDHSTLGENLYSPSEWLCLRQAANPGHVKEFKGLSQTLFPKEQYVVTAEMLLWALKRFPSIRIREYYEVITYKKSSYLKEYLEPILAKRTEAKKNKAGFMALLYKLAVNSVYGKTYEDATNRKQMVIVGDEQLRNLQGSPCKDYEFSREVMSIEGRENTYHLCEMHSNLCEINKPIYIGACVTDFSKLIMFQFWYDGLKMVTNPTLLYTDTDSVIFSTPDNLYDIARALNKSAFAYKIDCSNLDPAKLGDIPHPDDGKFGAFKSETGDDEIIAFCGLRAKLYCLKTKDKEGNEHDKVAAKGVPYAVQKTLTFDLYREQLSAEAKDLEVSFTGIRSKEHEVRSTHLHRIALSSDDLKRFILPDGIHTVPFGSIEHAELVPEVDDLFLRDSSIEVPPAHECTTSCALHARPIAHPIEEPLGVLGALSK